MPIMEQMTRSGSSAATDATKSPGWCAATSSTMSWTVRRTSSAARASTPGVKARETMPRRSAWRGSSRLTIESPSSTRAHRAGRGVVTP